MRRTRWQLLATLVAVVGIMGVAAPSARAQSSDDLKRKASQLADQIDKASAQLDQLAEDYNNAVAESQQLDQQVSSTSTEVDKMRTDLEGMRATLRDFAVRTFASGGQLGALGELLGGAGNFTDPVLKEQYATLALSNGQEVSNDLEAKLNALHAAERQLKQEQDRKAKVLATLQDKQTAAEAKQQELLGLQNQNDAALEQALLDEQKRRDELAAQQAQAELAQIRQRAIESNANQSSDGSSGGSSDNGGSSGGSNGGSSGGSNGGSNGSGGGGRGSGSGSGSNGGSGRGGGRGSSGGGNSGGGSSGGGNSGGNTGGSDNGGSTGGGTGKGGDQGGGGSGNGGGSGGTGGNGGGGGTDNGGGKGGGSGGGSGGAGHDVPPPSPGASGAIAAAKSQLGVPYRFGAAEPGVAFDCSGLTSWAWGRAGVSLPHQSGQQYATLPHVAIADIAPGDLIFFHSPISHVSMYIGDGQMIEAVQPGVPVSIHAVRWSSVVGVARPG